MKFKQPKIRVGERRPLVKNLLIVEGISRAGKFLLANLLHGFKDIEPVQSCGLLEQIPFLEKSGFIDSRVAEEFLRYEVDVHCYETLIGRTLNHRRSDKSSIYNIPHYAEYLQRSEENNTDKELGNFYKSHAYSFFIMHELLPNIGIFFKTFPKLKAISIQRSPVDLVYSWFQRGLAKRLGNDPKLFIIPLQHGRSMVPWYVARQARAYQKLSDMNRTVLAITSLFTLYDEAYQRLSNQQKKKIVVIRYEDILQKPHQVIMELQKFLGKDPLPIMKTILRRERLPNSDFEKDKAKKLDTIKSLASPRLFKELVRLEESFLLNNIMRSF